jgi:hypothetical protein
LINSANNKIEEGFKKNEELIRKLAGQNSGSKKYKNIEAEMEDYEPVMEEANESETSVIVDAPPLCKAPEYGEVEYRRNVEGDEEFFMQKVEPKYGGDSILGQHDVETEGHAFRDHEGTALFSQGDRHGSVKESEFKINKDDNGAYSEMTSQLNREKTDKEVYRSVK